MTETRTPTPAAAALARIAEVDAVLFDFDGTLVDTIPLILDSFRHATREVLGEAVPDEVLGRNVGIPLKVQFAEFTDDEALADQLLRVYRQYNRANHDAQARLFEGVTEALAVLAERRMPMGVVTSKARDIAWQGIELFALGGFFTTVITMDDVVRYKPDPLPLVTAAQALGVDVTRTIYVGDSPHDVNAALAAGALAVAAPWGVASRERLLEARPHFVLDSIADLPALIFGDAAAFLAL